MSPSLLALVVYAAWTLALLAAIGTMRFQLSVSGQRAPNRFSPTGDDVSPFSGRLCRAHANCYENLPVFAALIVAAALSGNGQITDGLALWVVGARIGQSTTHLISTRNRAILVRFLFMLVQIAIEAWWCIALLMTWSGARS
ncbi:MAG: MAPEG family protein [Pseudomonadota bacterium]